LAKLGTGSKRALGLAGLVLAVVWGGVAWRLGPHGDVTLEGTLRPGSLRCEDECHFELTLETNGGTRVLVDQCIMPGTLRDFPGASVDVLAAGRWEGERRLRATFLATKGGYVSGPQAASGRPPACFVPAARP
jgi:hypothetical protein